MLAGRALTVPTGGSLGGHGNEDKALVRVSISALVLFTGAGVALFIATWLIIREDGEDQSVAEAWIAGRRDRTR